MYRDVQQPGNFPATFGIVAWIFQLAVCCVAFMAYSALSVTLSGWLGLAIYLVAWLVGLVIEGVLLLVVAVFNNYSGPLSGHAIRLKAVWLLMVVLGLGLGIYHISL